MPWPENRFLFHAFAPLDEGGSRFYLVARYEQKGSASFSGRDSAVAVYTDKEIFVRELISNAADACEKLRFQQSSGKPIFQSDIAPSIAITTDDKANDSNTIISLLDLLKTLH